MMQQRLLYLNTHRLTAYVWQHGHLAVDGVFENNDAEYERFAQYLSDHAGSNYSLLANVGEEGHVVETIPFLQGKDRQALITRKIGQHFLGTPLALAVSLGYEKNKRKNERLLLSALTNPGHFESWLQRIDAAEASLTGLYSIAQLGGLLLKKLGHANQRALLLTVQDHSIRESFLVDGQPLFSRMAPLADSSIAGVASSLVAEAGKLHQYLLGQRQVGRDERLPAFIIVHPSTRPALERQLPERSLLDFTLIDSLVAANALHLKSPPEDNRSERLFLQLLATAPPAQQFADTAHRHHHRIARLRTGIVAAGLILLLGSILIAAKDAYDNHGLRSEAAELARSEAEMQQRYRDIAATFPQLSIDNDTLRRATTRYAEFQVQQRSPDGLWRIISQALDQMPAVQLEQLDWKIGVSGQSTAAVGLSGNLELATLRGSLLLDRATPRQTLAAFDRFLALLGSDHAVLVNVLQQPFDLESGRSLRGGDTDDNAQQARPFAIEISRGLAP